MSTAALPPFPYVDYPATLHASSRTGDKSEFDRAYVIAGSQLRELEGRIESRMFDNKDANLSELASRRNYETAIKALGGVKVNDVTPEDPALIAANGDEYEMRTKKLRVHERHLSYDTYLIRTPQTRVWIVLMVNWRMTQVLAIEEKAMVQTVGYISAAVMQSELAAKGRVALYINFDTDQATIRDDGKRAVDEIAALMKNDPALKLTIEGHTDSSGDPKHNKDLSQRRADAVLTSLAADGIDKARMAAAGLGDSKPLASNADETGRAKNRRVELVRRS